MINSVNSSKEKSVHFVSLGCPKNLVDSEMMLGSLSSDGYKVASEAKEAHTVVINTCGFIEDSKKESVQKILEATKLKEKGLIEKVVVTGCLVQRYKDELVNEIPEVDLFIGSGEFQNINKILKNHEAGDHQKKFFNLPTFLQETETPRINSQPKHRAYLKISEGCLKRCAFCAIPHIRGNLQSRKLDSILLEAKRLADSGVKELLIISHDFTDFGWDLRRKDPLASESPENLLLALEKIEGIKWIRLLYLYPDRISDEMLSIIKNSKKIVKYFDIPLQHISNPVLKSMNRKMTKEDIVVVLNKIRNEIPDAVIRTQFILGFPGETEADFEELLAFVKDQKFDRVGAFQYSQEEGTVAGKMNNQVDAVTKKRRHDKLMRLQNKISEKIMSSHIGKTYSVVIEGYSEETDLLLQGRNQFQAPDIDGVTLINSGTAKIGDFVQVKITDALDYDLIGEIV